MRLSALAADLANSAVSQPEPSSLSESRTMVPSSFKTTKSGEPSAFTSAAVTAATPSATLLGMARDSNLPKRSFVNTVIFPSAPAQATSGSPSPSMSAKAKATPPFTFTKGLTIRKGAVAVVT